MAGKVDRGVGEANATEIWSWRWDVRSCGPFRGADRVQHFWRRRECGWVDGVYNELYCLATHARALQSHHPSQPHPLHALAGKKRSLEGANKLHTAKLGLVR